MDARGEGRGTGGRCVPDGRRGGDTGGDRGGKNGRYYHRGAERYGDHQRKPSSAHDNPGGKLSL